MTIRAWLKPFPRHKHNYYSCSFRGQFESSTYKIILITDIGYCVIEYHKDSHQIRYLHITHIIQQTKNEHMLFIII